MRSLALCLVLCLPLSAHAWRQTGIVVPADERPLRWSVEVDPQVPNLTSEEVVAELQVAFDAWAEASCGFRHTFLGELDYDDPVTVPRDQLHLTFAPLGDRAQPFVAIGADPGSQPVFERDGRTFVRSRLGAWVVNTDYDVASDAAIEAGECGGQIAFTSLIGVFVGDRLGLGASSSRDALMGLRWGECTIVRPGEDDAAGLDALYGPWAQFVCENPDDPFGYDTEVSGVVPFQINCEVRTSEESTPTAARWRFGDGTTAEGLTVQHSYTSDDNYTLRVDVDGVHETCGDFTFVDERFNVVRACAEPVPGFRVERANGLDFRLLNESDVSTFGCHTEVRWRAFDSDEQLVFDVAAWEPRVRFPEHGEYRIELTLGGPAGTAVEEGWLDTREGSIRGYTVGNGCSHTGTGGLFAAFLGLAGLLRRRRR